MNAPYLLTLGIVIGILSVLLRERYGSFRLRERANTIRERIGAIPPGVTAYWNACFGTAALASFLIDGSAVNGALGILLISVGTLLKYYEKTDE